MGWFSSDYPGHEGYVIAFVCKMRDERPGFETGLLRALQYWEDDRDVGPDQIKWVAVECSCGWRSPRFHAPIGTEWFPFMVALGDERAEEAVRLLWREHVESDTVKRKHLHDILRESPPR